MTDVLTLRLPGELARILRAKTRAANTNSTAVLRHATAGYARVGYPRYFRSSTPRRFRLSATTTF